MATFYLHGVEAEYRERGLPAGRAERAAKRYESIYKASNGEKVRRFFAGLFKK